MTVPSLRVGRIILVDDDEAQLDSLHREVETAVNDAGCSVEKWLPVHEDVLKRFDALMETGATLVVTDYDLTKGASGFFGSSVVAWCQQLAIPVGDYSRGNRQNMPTEPNLFEFRLQATTREAAREIAIIYKGFKWIADQLAASPDLLKSHSPASTLAALLERPDLVSEFSMYASPLGTSAGLLDLVVGDRTDEGRRALSTYLLGHLLFNAILRYPGPILDAATACAYFCVPETENDRVHAAIASARYDGPFAELGPYYWRSGIDDLVDNWSEVSLITYTGEPATYRRALLQEKVGNIALEAHNCPRCHGELGGYRCPFTRAVVCERGECSVGSSLWIPTGADLCRVERDFYDETSPMLGN